MRSRAWRTSLYTAYRIAAWSTMATAATMTKNGSQVAIQAPLLGLRLFPLICIPASFDRGRNLVLLPRRYLLAALDQVIGALSQFSRLLLRVLLALIGFLREVFARVLA